MATQQSEAARIIRKLMDNGIGVTAIAQQIGTSRSMPYHILKGRSDGARYLLKLKAAERMVSATTPGRVADTSDVTPSLDILSGNDTSAPDIATAVTEVPELPADDRSTRERVTDWLKAAITGKGDDTTAPAPGASKAHKAVTAATADAETTVDLVAPLLALAIFAPPQLAIRDPYKAVGPSMQESIAFVTPLARIVAREMHVAGKISERTQDLIAAAQAMGMYGFRAVTDWRRIREESSGYAATGDERTYGGTTGGDAAAYPAPGASWRGGHTARSGPAPAGARNASAPDRAGGAEGGSERSNGHGTGDRRAADVLARLLDADAEGRRRLGVN